MAKCYNFFHTLQTTAAVLRKNLENLCIFNKLQGDAQRTTEVELLVIVVTLTSRYGRTT